MTAPSRMEVLSASIDAARARHATAEEMHPLMVAAAEEAERLGHSDAAASIRRSARSLVPMFGMTDRPKRRWWK